MEDFKVLLSKDGHITYMPSYILITPNKTHDGVELYSEANVYDFGLAVLAIYDSFAKEACKLPDQEIYEVCSAIGLDYDSIMDIVREYRKNG